MTIILTFIDVIDIPSGGRAFSFDFDLHDSAIEGSFFQHGCFDNMFSAGVGKNKSHHRLITISRGFIISKISTKPFEMHEQWSTQHHDLVYATGDKQPTHITDDKKSLI